MSTLEMIKLNKTFGDIVALNDMSLKVHPGEIYGFVGSNGAGKSTAMRIALGVLKPDSGEVRFGGQPMDDSLRRAIGYMPEERGLYAKEKILDQLIFLARLHGISTKEAKRNATELLEQLGLAERVKDQLSDLSLGNQQRVQLAASLVHNPQLLILDEPFSGLDPVAVSVMSDMLIARARSGIPVLFSSHQLDLVQRLCNRVGIITKGEMRAEGTVDQLRTRGPMLFEIHSPTHDWVPQGCTVVEQEPGRIVIEKPDEFDDQLILRAALAAGPVYSFTRKVPNLTDLFKEVVTA